jgi:hypothetical protein
MAKVIKVTSETGVWFETGEVISEDFITEKGREITEVTKVTKKFPWGATVRGVDDAVAERLEARRLVVIIGEDEDAAAPSQVKAPAKPAKGPAPSVDELTK